MPFSGAPQQLACGSFSGSEHGRCRRCRQRPAAGQPPASVAKQTQSHAAGPLKAFLCSGPPNWSMSCRRRNFPHCCPLCHPLHNLLRSRQQDHPLGSHQPIDLAVEGVGSIRFQTPAGLKIAEQPREGDDKLRRPAISGAESFLRTPCLPHQPLQESAGRYPGPLRARQPGQRPSSSLAHQPAAAGGAGHRGLIEALPHRRLDGGDPLDAPRTRRHLIGQPAQEPTGFESRGPFGKFADPPRCGAALHPHGTLVLWRSIWRILLQKTPTCIG